MKTKNDITANIVYGNELELTASTIVVCEFHWRDIDTGEDSHKTYSYIAPYDFNDPRDAAKIAEQFRRVLILNHPPFYYDTIRGNSKLRELGRRIIEQRPGYPIAEVQSDAEKHGQIRGEIGKPLSDVDAEAAREFLPDELPKKKGSVPKIRRKGNASEKFDMEKTLRSC